MLRVFPGKAMPFASGGETIQVRQLTLRAGVEQDVDPLKLCRYFRAASQEGLSLEPGTDIYDGRLHIDGMTRDGEVLVCFSEERRQAIAESVRLVDDAKAVLDKNPHEAITILNRSVGIWSRNARAYRHLGHAYAKDGNHLYSKASFERSIRRNPSDAEAYAGLGETGHSLGDSELAVTAFRAAIAGYLSQRRYGKAKKACQKALRIQQNHPYILFVLGGIHVELGEYEDARDVWKLAVKVEPNLLKNIVGMGTGCVGFGEYDKAKEILGCAIEIEPHNTKTLAYLGYAHCALGEYQEGKRAFRKALSIGPERLPWLANLAFAHLELDEYKEAKDVCERALSIDPSHRHVLLHLGHIYVHFKEYAKAKKVCRRLLRVEPDDYRALTTLGSAHLRLDEHKAARDACLKAIDIQPNYVPTLAYLADAYAELGDRVAAEDIYQRALDIEPNNMHALANLGGFYVKCGEFQKAKRILIRATEIEQGYCAAWNNLGAAHGGLGEFKEAKGAFKRALAIEPDNDFTLTNLGWALTQLKEFRAAIRAFERAIECVPNHIDAHLKLGFLYQLLGGAENYEKAREIYEELVAFWPNATAYYNLGEACVQLDEYVQARDAYRAVAEQEPTDEYNFLRVGVLSLAINDLDEAERYLERARPMFHDKDEVETCLAFMHWVAAKRHWDNKEWDAAEGSFQKASSIFAKLPEKEFAVAVDAYERSIAFQRNLDGAIKEDSIEGIYKRVGKALRSARKVAVNVERQKIPLLDVQTYCLEVIDEILSQARSVLRGERIRPEIIDALLGNAEEEFARENYESGLEAVDQLKKLRHNILDLNTGTQLHFMTLVKGVLKLVFTIVGLSVASPSSAIVYIGMGLGIGLGLSGMDLYRFLTRWQRQHEDEVIRIIEGLDKETALKELSDPRYASALRRIADPHSQIVRSHVLKSKAKKYLAELQDLGKLGSG